MQALPVMDGGTLDPATATLGPAAPDAADACNDLPISSPLARMALTRARMRTVIPLDVISFVAACPACGHDCEWTQERQETRTRSQLNCPCTP